MDEITLDQIIHEVVAKHLKKSLIVAGNWKMNMTVREGWEFLEKLGSVDENVSRHIQRSPCLRRKCRKGESSMDRRISIMKTAAPIREKFQSP